MTSHFAHSLPDLPTTAWEPLRTHLDEVAELAEVFADTIQAGEWGRIAGLWHDLGKYSQAFQSYLLSANGIDAHIESLAGRVDHSTAGAQHSAKAIPLVGRLLGYVIAGHHAGLADAIKLDERLKKQIESWKDAPDDLLQTTEISCPPIDIDSNRKQASFQIAFFTRMLFSCLVDADFLATEGFMNSKQAKERPRTPPDLGDIQLALENYLQELASEALNSEVNDCRQQVLSACREAASQSQGLFSLTVPTGGGKTLSSLSFALNHAVEHNLNRIVYAIPFTSIIDQTASTFREALGSFDDSTVLEHHSNLDPDKVTYRNRLAAENWDAPLVVTTNVQFFESLFASRTSRCRKLHNLVGSVIVLDEAQTLPVELLQPCLAALRELVTNYRCSIVLCTATQPALEQSDGFSIGLENLREIIPEPAQLYSRMKRVRVEKIGEQTDNELVKRLDSQESFLCIVNTRPHAAKIFDKLREQPTIDDSLFHLSTLLCGQHRADLLKKIRHRLIAGQPCRVVSTQLIEAGVDVDFPVVFRAMTGIDSIAQAAGRCNREGLQKLGTVFLFDPVECQPKGYLGSVAATTREILPDIADLLDLSAVQQYFDLHYWKHQGEDQWDDKQVMACFPQEVERLKFDFRTASERFRIIEDSTKPIFVPYKERGIRLTKELEAVGPSRLLLRRLQRYTVSVYETIYQKLLATGDIELTPDGYAVLTNESLYDDQLGLRIDRPGWREPESMVI